MPCAVIVRGLKIIHWEEKVKPSVMHIIINIPKHEYANSSQGGGGEALIDVDADDSAAANVAFALLWLKDKIDEDYYVEKRDDDINATNAKKVNAFLHAIFYNAPLQVIEILLNNLSKDTIKAQNILEDSALHVACWLKHPQWEIVQSFLDQCNKETINATN